MKGKNSKQKYKEPIALAWSCLEGWKQEEVQSAAHDLKLLLEATKRESRMNAKKVLGTFPSHALPATPAILESLKSLTWASLPQDEREKLRIGLAKEVLGQYVLMRAKFLGADVEEQEGTTAGRLVPKEAIACLLLDSVSAGDIFATRTYQRVLEGKYFDPQTLDKIAFGIRVGDDASLGYGHRKSQRKAAATLRDRNLKENVEIEEMARKIWKAHPQIGAKAVAGRIAAKLELTKKDLERIASFLRRRTHLKNSL